MKRLSGEHSKALELNLSKTMEEVKACAFGQCKRSKKGNNHGRGTLSTGPCGLFEPEASCGSAGLTQDDDLVHFGNFGIEFMDENGESRVVSAHRAFEHAGRAGRCRQRRAQHAARQVGGSDRSG